MAIYYGDANGKAQEVIVVGKPGPQGPAGPQGAPGPQGPAGQGVPTGGTAGMVLTKTGNTDSESNWQTPKVSANNVTAGTLPSGVNISANQVTSGTLSTGVKASTASDYTTARLRNIKAGTSDLTAGSSSLANGEIYLVYE